MPKTLIEKIWKRIPYFVRLKVIRSFQKKFTVSVVAIVSNENDEILVLDHYFRPGASWGLPGGFIDPYEQTEEAIKRELIEETNVKLENLRLVHVRTIGKHLEILYLAEGIGEAKVNSREIREVGWFSLNNLPDGMSEIQKQNIKKILGKDK